MNSLLLLLSANYFVKSSYSTFSLKPLNLKIFLNFHFKCKCQLVWNFLQNNCSSCSLLFCPRITAVDKTETFSPSSDVSKLP